MSTSQDTIDWYNQHADEYFGHISDKSKSPYHAYYEKPAIRAELPDLKGKIVLCLGCATGEDCDYLKQQGAKRAVGIDIAEKLLELAKRDYQNCEFYQMDMEKLEFEDSSFDLVYSGLAIHYLIGGFDKVLAESYRVLKPAGVLLFSDGHPISSAMEYIPTGSDLRDKRLGIKRKEDLSEQVFGDYLTSRSMEAALLKNDSRVSQTLTFWHQPLSRTVNQIIEAGFVLDRIVEPLPAEGFKKVSPRHYERLSRIPEMVIFKAHKP